MQYLCIFKTRDITDTTSRRVQRALVASIDKLLEYRSEGKIVSLNLMDERTPLFTYAVFDVESPEELDKLLWGIPGLPFMHTNIHATFSVESARDALTARLESNNPYDID